MAQPRKAQGDPRSPRGSRSKLTPEVLEALAKAKRLGVPDNHACRMVNVHQATLYAWLQQGKEHREQGKKSPYRELSERFEKAVGERTAESLLRIRNAANGGAVVERTTVTVTHADGTTTTTSKEKVAQPQWTADAWFLERTDPVNFAQKVRTELTGANGGPVQVSNKTWTEMVLEAAEARRRKAQGQS